MPCAGAIWMQIPSSSTNLHAGRPEVGGQMQICRVLARKVDGRLKALAVCEAKAEELFGVVEGSAHREASARANRGRRRGGTEDELEHADDAFGPLLSVCSSRFARSISTQSLTSTPSVEHPLSIRRPSDTHRYPDGGREWSRGGPVRRRARAADVCGLALGGLTETSSH